MLIGMESTRLSLASFNPTVGAFADNAAAIVTYAHRAMDDGADLVICSRNALAGPRPADLAARPDFIYEFRQALVELAGALPEIPVIVTEEIPELAVFVLQDGAADPLAVGEEPASFFSEVGVIEIVTSPAVASGAPVAARVWVDEQPFARDVENMRMSLLAMTSSVSWPMLYLNGCGGHDSLILDGAALALTPGGRVVARRKDFSTDPFVVDVQADGCVVGVAEAAAPMGEVERVYRAVVTGLRDYLAKNGFTKVALGLSGGIDSALVAALAADAIGGSNIIGVSMPSAYSSDHSRSDADDTAERLGLDYRVQPIAPIFNAFEKEMDLDGVAEENLQARIRGMILMAISNSEGALVLATGNRTEVAVGYSTIYGDTVGGYAPLCDVPKTLVWEMARWRNAHAQERGEVEPIPEHSITKPPSAELRPGQKDTDSLPDYQVLDGIIERLVDDRSTEAQVIAEGFDAATVEQVSGLIKRSEWKRQQEAFGPSISKVTFGLDRHYPTTHAFVPRRNS